jgi:predicted Zn finger-like uncharacterized protein
MPEDKYTRCPGCATVFRVTAEQLAMRAGQVRCGQCKTVFDGVAQRVSLSPATLPDAAAVPVDAAASSQPDDAAAPVDGAVLLGPDTAAVPPFDGAALPGPDAAVAPVDDGAPASPTSTLRDPQARETPADTTDTADAASARLVGAVAALAAREDRFAPAASTKPGPARIVAYAFAIVLLVLLIAGQAAFHYRDAIATFWPAARPAFARLCAVAGCAVGPLRDMAMANLSIEASDLQADPAHRGLLILTATVRNRAGWPLAYPHFELTLTDAQDRIVVRRALAPAEYAGGTADLAGGIAANSEIAFKIFIDASATSQAGYRLYMFYP